MATASGAPLTDPPTATLREFLESTPPGRMATLHMSSVRRQYSSGTRSMYRNVTVPEVSLHCEHADCGRVQNFRSETELIAIKDSFLSFTCRNCNSTVKTYALRLIGDTNDVPDPVVIYKFGEVPSFGPPLSAKLMQLAGGNGLLLKKGRRSENQGLGIAAFAYYRRVVEEQKGKLIDEILKAAERLSVPEEARDRIRRAKDETQFTTALDLVADLLPTDLFVKGQNPLKLLHGPLSVGLHGQSDEECLRKAHSIRVLLTALLERVQQVTAEDAELDAAIRDVLQR